MSIDDRARLSMYQRLEQVLGAQDADTLMAHLPPSGWGDLATKGDLALTASGLRSEMDALRSEMDALRADIRGQLAEFRSQMYRSQRQLTITLVGVMAVMNSALVAVVAALR